MESRKPKYPYYVFMIFLTLGALFIADTFFHSLIPHPVTTNSSPSTKPTEVVPEKVEPISEILTPVDESTEPQVQEISETPSQEQDVKADFGVVDYFTELLSRNLGTKTRNDIVVRYYRHLPDGNKIDELRKYGLYIHERPVEGELEGYESNSLYYGDSVSQEDIHLIAYVMLKQGLPIKSIQPSIYHDDWKANSVEIGTDTAVNDDPVLTLTEIRNFSN